MLEKIRNLYVLKLRSEMEYDIDGKGYYDIDGRDMLDEIAEELFIITKLRENNVPICREHCPNMAEAEFECESCKNIFCKDCINHLCNPN